MKALLHIRHHDGRPRRRSSGSTTLVASLEEKLSLRPSTSVWPDEDSKDTSRNQSRIETGVAVEFDCPAGAIKDRSTSPRTTSAN